MQYPEDGESKLVAEAGNRHEEKFLKSLRDEGKDICEIERGPDAFAQTARAIADKRKVIFQTALRMDSFSIFSPEVGKSFCLTIFVLPKSLDCSCFLRNP